MAGTGDAAPPGGAVRVVVDTNVVVAAGFKPHSAAAGVLAAVRDGRLRLVWDAPTRAETRAVVTRIPRLAWEPFAALYRAEDEHTAPTDPAAFTVVEDPGDRKFAALAAATAAVLVSNDAHLLSCSGAIGVAVVTPRAFLDGWDGGRASAPAPQPAAACPAPPTRAGGPRTPD